MRSILVALLVSFALALSGPRASGQEQETHRLVEGRVIATRPDGAIVVDRGRRDGLESGDLVLFFPRTGGTYEGTVGWLDEREAVVDLHDEGSRPKPGTRCEILIPIARLSDRSEEKEEVAPDEEPPWPEEEERWTPDLPLLADLRPVRPDRRAVSLSGRHYLYGDATWSPDDDLADSYARVGGDLLCENPFGRGGSLHVGTELDSWSVELVDQDDQSERNLRMERLSYHRGGTRFSPSRWEVGRFLQHGVPEFGVLDGYEWGHRRRDGDRYGASIGFMPEPTEDLDTGDDFQVSAYYHRVLDRSERLTITGGYQKTLHDGASDRDLLVAKARYLPLNGWDAYATTWVDRYGSHDRNKSSSFELTRALASVRRRWESGSGLALTWGHERFPEIDRQEFTPVTLQQLANDHSDRLSLNGWKWLAEDRRLHGRLGGWFDEDESGGDALVGIEVQELYGDRSRGEFALFLSAGEFSSIAGAQTSFVKSVAHGRWDVFYQIAMHDQRGFTSDRDDVLQHRLHVGRDFFDVSGWTVSLYGEGVRWDESNSWSAGLYAQRGF